MNYEFEQANKARYDHLNLLVYKDSTKGYGEGDKENRGPTMHKTQSNAIFQRLTEKEINEMKRASLEMTDAEMSSALNFNEWLRRKDAERRMRRRLIDEAKNEIR